MQAFARIVADSGRGPEGGSATLRTKQSFCPQRYPRQSAQVTTGKSAFIRSIRVHPRSKSSGPQMRVEPAKVLNIYEGLKKVYGYKYRYFDFHHIQGSSLRSTR
jgi:hypothetical protein